MTVSVNSDLGHSVYSEKQRQQVNNRKQKQNDVYTDTCPVGRQSKVEHCIKKERREEASLLTISAKGNMPTFRITINIMMFLLAFFICIDVFVLT